MKMRTLALLAAVVAMTGAGPLWIGGVGRAFGEEPKGLLDQGLGETDTNKPAPAAPAPVKKVEAKAPAAEVVNPDAVNKVDSDDLTKKLTGQGGAEEGPEKMLKEVVDRMGESEQRLKAKDPGEVTQETQRRIVINLDGLIELVKKQQQKGQGSPQSGPPKPGEKKQQNSGQQQGSKPGEGGKGGNTAAQSSGAPPGGSDPAQSNGQDMKETRQEWGNLPAKDRDMVVTGSREDALPSYRDLVARYYQALADLNRTSRDK